MIVELLQNPPEASSNGAAAARPRGAERRRSRRHAVAIPATLTSMLGPVTDVRVRDISLHGVGLLCDAPPPEVGDEYLLDIGAGSLKLHARIRIANARPRRDGQWDVGAEFCVAG